MMEKRLINLKEEDAFTPFKLDYQNPERRLVKYSEKKTRIPWPLKIESNF